MRVKRAKEIHNNFPKLKTMRNKRSKNNNNLLTLLMININKKQIIICNIHRKRINIKVIKSSMQNLKTIAGICLKIKKLKTKMKMIQLIDMRISVPITVVLNLTKMLMMIKLVKWVSIILNSKTKKEKNLLINL